MSAQARWLELHQTLTRLNQEASAILERGNRLEALRSLFERKAALSQELAQIPLQMALEGPIEREVLLRAQEEAALSEAVLVKVLQPFVASIEKMRQDAVSGAPKETGKHWDFWG